MDKICLSECKTNCVLLHTICEKKFSRDFFLLKRKTVEQVKPG